jgi:hypothetical protein
MVSAGRCRPYWSVLTHPLQNQEMVHGIRKEFFESGKSNLEDFWLSLRIWHTLLLRTDMLELGCGVGRLTAWLSTAFSRVCRHICWSFKRSLKPFLQSVVSAMCRCFAEELDDVERVALWRIFR